MKIETMGKTLIAIGTAIMLYSRAMSVSANDSGIVNIYLMSERQNTLNFGGLLFIAGIVFFAVFKMKQTKEESNLDIERKRERSEQTKMRVDAALRKTVSGLSTASLARRAQM